MDDLKTILDRMRKPLSFAGRDDFAHLKSLTALESFMHAQVDELKRISNDTATPAELEKLFVGFDSLPTDEKKKRIVAASLLIAALERTREIGIRMAIGAKTWDIRLQFIIEALALSLIGGVIGIIVGPRTRLLC